MLVPDYFDRCSFVWRDAECLLKKGVESELSFRVVPDHVQDTVVILCRPFTEAPNLTYQRIDYDLTFADIDESLFKCGKEKPMCL